ncbi:prominin-like protein isoform X2 [Cylas formicarius]|uniref:prominin-like protein isoform X2 n=1 Tax=Cylas formicarius TaxID=197179 RepID=UPI0029589087|nr:prominin-like protein isoform X2 [Cylas formicarius]
MESRNKINAFNFLLTCVFLFVAVEISDGGSNFAKKISKITENLDEAVLNLSSTVNYTDYNLPAQYVSNVQFSAKGMAGLYNLTTMFMDLVLPTDFFMEGLLTVNDRNLNVNIPDYKDALRYYWRPLTIIVVLLVFLAFFPLCGICFCFCRCCGNCGARSKPADKKRDLCAKIIQGTILIALCTGLLFCVVCAFGSNQQLQDGVRSFPNNMRNSVKDTSTFLNQTQNETSHLLVNNYIEFVNVFTNTMDGSTSTIMDQLEVYSNATGMLKLAEFVNNLPTIENTLYSLRNNSNRLRVYASQLNDALRKVKGDLLITLKECVELNIIKECEDLNDKISRLETNIDFNKLPDVSEQIEILKDFDTSAVVKAANDGLSKLKDIRDTIESKLNIGLNEARTQINNANKTITDQLNSMFTKLDDIKREIKDNAYSSIDTADDFISQYGQYGYYCGLGISCILLLVTLCIALGLICGICGKRPDGYSDNCCNKGAGSQFLVCAVMIMFFFGCVLIILTLAMFLLGATSDRAICTPLRNPDPQDLRIIKVIDDLLSLSDQLEINDIKFSNILSNCYQNKSLYQTLNLHSVFDLEKLKTEFNVSEYLDKIKFDDLLKDPDFCILCENRQELERLKDLKFDVDLEKFRDELENNFTNFSLDILSEKLQSIISQLSDPVFTDIKNKLELSALHLDTYNEKLLVPMKDLARDVIDISTDLKNNLTMGNGNFADSIDLLISEINDAEMYLKHNGTTKLGQIAKEFTEIVIKQVNSYIYRIADQVNNRIGECGPLNVVINATLISTCDKLLLPWNGFWFSLFWSLVLYVFTIVICVKLASLYQKYKPYGQYVETEYLYDAYADRGDSIPLNSRGGKRNKKKNKKSKRHDDRPPSAGGEVVAREYTAASHPPDGRYADMAPKHWEEFPNGGPPQYQRATTEYERPPPYYYPGTAGEQ